MDGEKIVVNVKSEAEGRLVIETAEDGEETYYPANDRTLYLHVDTLQVGQRASTFSFLDEELRELPTPIPYVHGTAQLEGNFISVIGEPENKNRTLTINFRAIGYADRKEREAATKIDGQAANYTRTTLGFERADWEIGNSNQWWVECEVSPETFSAISSAVSSGDLKMLSVGLKLSNIYVDDCYAPQHVKRGWYLRPRAHDNTIQFPEIARGGITFLNMGLASVDFRPPPPTEPDTEAFDPSEPMLEPAQVDQNAVALNALSLNVEKLGGTLKWVGGFIAFFLLMLALK